MRETLAVIDAPHFHAGIVLWDDRVVEAADIVRYMKQWTRTRVRNYCVGKNWQVTVVHELERSKIERRIPNHGKSKRPITLPKVNLE